jgi:quinolinate synthase
MKATDLSRILRAMERPAASQRIEVPAALRERARRPIERMFELAEDKAAS